MDTSSAPLPPTIVCLFQKRTQRSPSQLIDTDSNSEYLLVNMDENRLLRMSFQFLDCWIILKLAKVNQSRTRWELKRSEKTPTTICSLRHGD